MTKTRTAGILAALLIAAAPGRAGVIVTAETTATSGGAATAAPVVHVAYVDADRLRIESPTLGGRVLLFRKDRQVVVFLHPDKRTYAEATRADMRKLRDQMDAAEARYRRLLKQLPSHRGPLLDDLLRNPNAPPYQTPPVVYKPVPGAATIGGWTCARVEEWVGGRLVGEIFTTPWTALGVADEEVRAMVAYGDFYRDLAGANAPVFPFGVYQGPTEHAYAGVPIRRVDRPTAGAQRITEIRSVARQILEAGLFEIPAGYVPVDAYPDLTRSN
jgi:hypothetical protein